MTTAMRLPLVCITLAVAAVGCGVRPSAPPITREPVFSDDTIGLTFTTPEGWTPISRGVLPPGPLAKPQVLAAYMLPKGERPTELELMVSDPIPEGGLEAFLAEAPIGPEVWLVKEKPTPVEVNGVPAERMTMTRQRKQGEISREATAFRRPDRTYLFVITFLSSDRTARDAAHKCVESVTWR